MDKNNFLQDLKTLLAVPSYFNEEYKMIAYIEEVLSSIPNIKFNHDQYGNIYVTKGISEYYPLVCAHTDTVHHIDEYRIEEEIFEQGIILKGVKDVFIEGRNITVPSGCGGDNKTGIMVCLELIKSQEILKAAFFFGEEKGCKGSTLADPAFFTNVGYCLEFDAPDDHWVTHVCFGQKLFDTNGEFWNIAKPIIDIHCDNKRDPYWNNHPYTDVYPLKALYDFSCLNYSSGYINMHTAEEKVFVPWVEKALDTARTLLNALGNIKYQYINNPLKIEDMRIGNLSQYIKFK